MNHKFLLLIIIMIAAATGCGSDEPCSVQSEDFLFEIGRIENKSQRIATNPLFDEFALIDEAELLLEEIKDLNPPRCAREVQDALIAWFESAIVMAKASVTNGEVSVEFFTAEREVYEAISAYSSAKRSVELDFDE